jgi:hypothetical protein
MQKNINETKEQEEVKKLFYVIVFLSLFVVMIFGLVPFAE